MNKVKILSILTITLLLLNLFLVGFMISNKPPRQGKDGPRNIIIEKLKFNDNQIEEYDKLIKWHRTEMDKSEEELKVLKNQLYSTLTKDSANNLKDSIISEINKVQFRIESIHYKHFMDIKNLCNKDQEPSYIELTTEIASLFGGPRNRREPK